MSKREREYIRGEKEERFKRKIKGIEKKKILGISIDVSKDYHKALIFDFEGRLVDGPFEFNVFKDGYENFKQRVEKAIEKKGAKKIFFGLEPTGSYHENLARHVSEWFMVPLSKSGLRLCRSVGSNPTLSASYSPLSAM